jgi:PIN domain nuclease of toxin-antitoxin system
LVQEPVDGGELIFRWEGDELRITTLKQNIERASVTHDNTSSRSVAGGRVDCGTEGCTGLVGEILPFTSSTPNSRAASAFTTRSIGLSLGDRACLALALELKAVVYTERTARGRI